MDELGDVIAQMSADGFRGAHPLEAAELAARRQLVGRLFLHYGVVDVSAANRHFEETLAIPWEPLALACRIAIRTHVYPNVPSVAELWKAARAVAGMDRQQYHAGRYLPVPTEWPPQGHRHAVLAGELEALPAPLLQLAARTDSHELLTRGDGHGLEAGNGSETKGE